MIFPETFKEVQNLLNKIPEDLHLEYKSGNAIDYSKVAEISKDVSAFANSDGGVLIYGVQEDKSTHLPVSIDGVDFKKYSHEWLENIIKSNISPIIPDIIIKPIKIKGNTALVIYSILIPKSYRTPHQAKDKKYYKRYNFKSEAMDDYEINDIRNRQTVVPPLVNVRAELSGSDIFLLVSNDGEQVAQNVSFDFPQNLEEWAKENDAVVFLDGIKFLAPKQSFRFYYEFVNMILGEDSNRPSQFKMTATYFHPLISQKITETFHIDLNGYFGTISYKDESHFRAEKIERALNDLTSEVKKINENLSNFSQIAKPTGLNLSYTSLRNLKNLEIGKPFEKLPIPYRNFQLFQEVLQIDYSLALNLRNFFRLKKPYSEIKNVEGITEEVIERLEKYFILDDQMQ